MSEREALFQHPFSEETRQQLRSFGQASYDRGYALGLVGKPYPDRPGRASWLTWYGWMDGQDARRA